MRVTGEGIWGPPRDHGAAIRVLRRAVEIGVNFIDTADSYGPEISERLIAEALHPYPAGLVIATKGGLLRHRPQSMAHRRPGGTPARGGRGQSAAAAARPHRPLSVPSPGPESALRGVGRRAGGIAAGGQDPAHRPEQRKRRATGAAQTIAPVVTVQIATT